jgi:hypothetical protein
MATLLNVPLVNGLQKTLDAQLDAGTTASATLNNTTNIQAPGVFVVNRIDANGNEKSASDREFIKFTGVSGNTLTGLTRNADGGTSDQDHAVGSIVEFVADVIWAQALVDVIETEHNSDGTHASTIVKTTATQTLTNKTLTSPTMTGEVYFDAEVDNGNSGTEKTIDWTAGNKQKITLTDNCTFTFTAPSGVCNLILKVVQDGTGSRTITWPATVKWPEATAPTLTTTAAGIDIVAFYWDGANYFGQASLAFGVPA